MPSKPPNFSGKERTIFLWRLLKSATSPRDKQRLQTEIYELNKTLLPKFVHRYTRFSRVHHDPVDLFQTAAMAMIQALENFDPAKGAFSTHVEWRVRKEIERALLDHLPIRMQNHGYPFKAHQKIDRFMLLHGRFPTGEEIGEKQADLDRWQRDSVVRFRGIQIPAGKASQQAERDSRQQSRDDIEAPGPYPDQLLETAQDLWSLNRILAHMTPTDRSAILTEQATPEVIARARVVFLELHPPASRAAEIEAPCARQA